MIVDRNGCIEVCVYADTLNIFSEEGLNQLGSNMIYIKVPKDKLYEYFVDTCLEYFRDEVDKVIRYEEWLDEYTCDDTIDLYEWMRRHNMILEIGLTYKVNK